MYDAGLFDPLDDDDQVGALVSFRAYCLVEILSIIILLIENKWEITPFCPPGTYRRTMALKFCSCFGRPGFLGLHAGDASDDG